MRLIEHQNTASSKISVTDTATLLYSLINTAGGVTNSEQYFSNLLASGLLITPEDGDIRVMVGQTPDSTHGTLLSSATKYYIPLIDLSRLRLIRAGGANVACSIDLFKADVDDTFFGGAEKVEIEGLTFDGSGNLNVNVQAGGSGGVTDTDDDDIAKGQTLPLGIDENYIFSKTADAWVRQQGTDDGIAFNEIVGIFTPNGDSAMDDTTDTVKVSGSLTATVSNSGIFIVQENGDLLTHQSDGSQKTQIVDGSGNVIGSTSNALDVNINNPFDGAVTNAGTFAVQPGAALTGPGNPTVDSYGQVAINLAAGNDQVLVSSAANKQIWVYGYHFMVNVAGTVSFQDEDNTALSGIMPFGDKGGATVSPSGNFAMPIWKLATDKDLEVDIVTSEMDGWLSYAIISV